MLGEVFGGEFCSVAGREYRLRCLPGSMPSNSNFNPVQSICRVRTCDQSPIKRPASSRFAHTQNPERSKYKTRICVARLLMKQ